MKLCDVDVLVYAHRPDSIAEHADYANFVTAMASGPSAFALSEAVLSGFIRIATNPRIFKGPTPTATALAFCRALRESPQACLLRPGERNWTTFESLCQTLPARARWRHPLS